MNLREAAQQALEALCEFSVGCRVDAVKLNNLIAALEAALAEPVEEPGCDHCNHPLWCGTKCKSCGKVREWTSGVEE